MHLSIAESGGVKAVWKTGEKVKLKPLGRGSGARKPTYGTLEYFYISGEQCVVPWLSGAVEECVGMKAVMRLQA